MGQVMDEAMTDPFDLLLGRKTYEIFAAHWPYMKADSVAEKFNAATKYVATSSTEPLSWKNSVALNNVAIDIARLKQEDGPNLLIQGSGNLIQTLMANDSITSGRLRQRPIQPVGLSAGVGFWQTPIWKRHHACRI
jgi:dihydrofolate reductase